MTSSPELTIDLLSQHALDLMEQTSDSLFLTGKAGTGKSTLLRHFINTTEKRVIVLASTGIAAINVGGQTIHSFFRLGNHADVDALESLTGKNAKLLYEADTIVIDEVSMVRADLMDCLDKVMRYTLDIEAPFGGKQVIFVGDLYQLPPIVSGYEIDMFNSKYKSAYFFSSPAYQELFPHVVSLQKVHRQSETLFANILNKMRIGLHDKEDLEILSEQVTDSYPEGAVYLTTTNKSALELNEFRLSALEGELHTFGATIKGKMSKSMYPNMIDLEFKSGAQIMMIKNGKGYSNGSIGELVGFDPATKEAIVVIEEKEYIIEPHTWQVVKPVYNKEVDKIIPEPVGSFQQFPFRLARAITIHKAQGLTFENVIVDLSQGVFAQGQSYVALSRATSLKGLYLTQKVRHSDIRVNPQVRKYMHQALREQTNFLVQTAIEENAQVRFLYSDPMAGPIFTQIKPIEVGELQHGGYDFHGMKGLAEGQTSISAYSYGRIHDMELV